MSGNEMQAPAAEQAVPQKALVDIPTAALVEQLKQLNERARMHASRLWQLPFAYLGLVALIVGKSDLGRWGLLAASLAIILIGASVLFAMLGAYEGISRAGNGIGEIERHLGLRQTASLSTDWLASMAQHRVNRLASHFLPYFFLVTAVVLGAIFFFIALLWSKDDVKPGSSMLAPIPIRFEVR